MTLLLDTHTFLWWITDDDRLSQTAWDVIADAGNTLYLSAASNCEIAIKSGLGRLEFAHDPERVIPEQMAVNAVEGLAIAMAHALRVNALPHHHRDPFDRLLVAQALLDDLPIVTNDPLIVRYAAEMVW